jgi:hypothetical protein
LLDIFAGGNFVAMIPPRIALGFVLCVAATGLVAGVLAQSDPKPLSPSGVLPAHDPSDILFRRAPTGLSSRSIVFSLATNLHLAFDAKLLRTHTVWEGAALNLFGSPFNNTAARFICDFAGTLLWGNVPVHPWELARPDGNGFNLASTRFLGVSTKGNQCTFLFELSPIAAVEVRETPRNEIKLA